MALEPVTPTVIVGASAAGLATAAELQRLGQPCEIVEAGEVVAGAWRRHYDRLHLHTTRSISALPGFPMPKSWGRYPSRDHVVEYLDRYQQQFDLRPHFGEEVERIERVGDTWTTTTARRSWRSHTVVIATGRTRIPLRPTWPGMDQFRGQILHSSEYRNGDPWRGQPVLVVGFGNSACEEALDLVEHGARAHLSVRSPVNVIPRDMFGVVPIVQLGILMRRLPPKVADALAWPLLRLAVGDVRKVGLRKLPYGPNTQIARDHQIPLLDIGTMEHIRAGRIEVHRGIDHFTDDGVVFSDGSTLAVDAVVLATGYRAGVDDFLVGWENVCDASGTPRHSGVPAHEGLYFCGMFVSPAGMLREIGREATAIASDIASRAH